MTKKIFLKKIRSVFNENTDQFYVLKKIKFVFNENTDQFYVLKSNLKNLDQILV